MVSTLIFKQIFVIQNVLKVFRLYFCKHRLFARSCDERQPTLSSRWLLAISLGDQAQRNCESCFQKYKRNKQQWKMVKKELIPFTAQNQHPFGQISDDLTRAG